MGEKRMQYLEAPNIRALVKGANELLIKKEDVVEIVTLQNCYILVYYG